LGETLRTKHFTSALTYVTHNLDGDREAMLLLKAFELYTRFIPYLAEVDGE